MPCYCAKMNNGSWRVYSTIVDDYITDDMSFEELKAWRRAAAIRRADEESDTLLTERPSVNVCTQEEADYWAGINLVVDEPSEPLGGISDEDEF